MVIKNVDRNSNYISNPYNACRKLDKTDTVANSTETGTAFSNDMNRISKASKVDTIELSRKTVSASRTLSETRDNILLDINKDKDTQYIDTLKAQLNSCQYAVNPLEIAKAMLSESTE